MIEQRILYYGDPRFLDQPTTLTRPINIVFLTSVRDTGIDDGNGTWVNTDDGSQQYMEGAIHRIVRATHPLRGALGGIIRLAGVFTDDMPRDLRDSSYGVLPPEGRKWLHPLELANPDGQLISDITFNIPSTFRSLKKNALAERARAKFEFEQKVLQKMMELGGDILVSDHLMMRLDYLWGEFGLYGKILNIHPAITVEGHAHCNRGPTPTANSIRNAREGKDTITGATLHCINKAFDAGPVITYVANTPVFADDKLQPLKLKYRNYQGAKLPLLIAGLAHYARNIYPYLNEMTLNPYNSELDDLSKLQPMCEPRIIQDEDRRVHNYENILLR